MQQVLNMTCPGCGASVTTGQSECEYCHKPIVISTFNSVNSMPLPEINKYGKAYAQVLSENPNNPEINTSIAFCYLKLKLFDRALAAFERSMEGNIDNSETFFYAAVSLMGGQKPFLHQRSTIDKMLSYINAAIMIEPLGIYHYFRAYIKYDYFEKKYLDIFPAFDTELNTAYDIGVSNYDIEQLFAILGVDNPFI